MKTTLERISEFLGVPVEKINQAEQELREKLMQACNSDDYMTIHHLGYNLIKKEV